MIYTYQERLRGKKVGVVFGTFAPLHQGHLDVIMRAKKECDGGCVVIVDGREGDRGGELMPLKLRYRYVREFFADDDLVAVYPIDETELGIEAYPNGWDKFMDKVDEIIDNATNLCEAVFYVSEEEYATHLEGLGYEVVKLDRTLNPISATMIRQNPIKYWDKITFPFRRVFSTNILICGTARDLTALSNNRQPNIERAPIKELFKKAANTNRKTTLRYIKNMVNEYPMVVSLAQSYQQYMGKHATDTSSMHLSKNSEYNYKAWLEKVTDPDGPIKLTREEVLNYFNDYKAEAQNNN